MVNGRWVVLAAIVGTAALETSPARVWAQACGPLAGSFAPAPASPHSMEQASSFWGEGRREFPLHVQGTFARPPPSGDTALVTAEPPPHATAEGIARRLGALHVETHTTKRGFDGWAKDVVAMMGRRDPAEIREAEAR